MATRGSERYREVMSDGGGESGGGQPEASGGGEADLAGHGQIQREDAGSQGLGEFLAIMPEGFEDSLEDRAESAPDEELLD